MRQHVISLPVLTLSNVSLTFCRSGDEQGREECSRRAHPRYGLTSRHGPLPQGRLTGHGTMGDPSSRPFTKRVRPRGPRGHAAQAMYDPANPNKGWACQRVGWLSRPMA